MFKKPHLIVFVFAMISLSACGSGGNSEYRETPALEPNNLPNNLIEAVSSGDPGSITDSEEILDVAIANLKSIKQSNQNHLQAIYGNSPVIYNPGKSSQVIVIRDYDRFIPLVIGNKGEVLAAAGIDDGTRYAAFGSNPISFFVNEDNLDYKAPFKRLLAWLLSLPSESTAALNQPLNIGLTMLRGSDNFTISGWIEDELPEWQVNFCDDEETLAACYAEQDLLIVASNEPMKEKTVTEALEQSLALEIPLLFMHENTWASFDMDRVVLPLLNFNIGPYGGNWQSNDQADWSHVSDMLEINSGLNSVQAMLRHLKANDYDFQWNDCTSNLGTVSCDEVPGLSEEFEKGAFQVRSILEELDSHGVRLFDENAYSLTKHLVLLGDVYRKSISYPMDKESTDSNEFFKAFYADHAVYYNRSVNPKQPDLGTFSKELPVDLPSVTKTITFPAFPHGGFTTTALYAIPGQTITIQRLDSGTDTVKIFLNSLRTGSSRVYNQNLYNRPKYLKSHSILLPAGGNIRITSPYGGPVFVEPSQTHSTELEISGAVQHAVLHDMSDISSYESELEMTPFTWTEIKTPFVEIHSRTDKMLSAINSPPYGGDAEKLIDDIWVYLIKDSYELAGFVGEGLSHSISVTDFCQTMGWDCTSSEIHGAPKTQHINIDLYAHCGIGCSGNPYDQSWAISPEGWGESHEIGHNLQQKRLKIYDGQSSEVSNQIFPLHKYFSYNADKDVDFEQKANYAGTFNTLQSAVNSTDPFQVAYDDIWAETGYRNQNSERMSFYMQIVHQGEALAFLDNGWELLTLMYLQNRLFESAENWETQKEELGFSNYIKKPDMDGNDFMLISMSWISGMDQRSFFDMWGVSYSQEASAQVAEYGFPSAGKFFYIPEGGIDYNPVQHIVPVDGSHAWPLN